MDNYARIEEAIDEAEKNVAGLDAEQFRRQEEVEASDAARHEARELGVDLTTTDEAGDRAADGERDREPCPEHP